MERVPPIPEVLQEHFESFAVLWRLWCDARSSPDYRLPDLRALENRIEAHLDGLRVAGGDGRNLAIERLAGDDAAESFVAAYLLLESGGKPEVDIVVDAFLDAEGDRLAALRDALRLALSDPVLTRLRSLLNATSGVHSAAVAEILAAAGELDPSTSRLIELLSDSDVEVRAAAWRAAGILDSMSELRTERKRPG